MEVAMTKREITVNTYGAIDHPKIKIPKPKHFGSARISKELENFFMGYGVVFYGCFGADYGEGDCEMHVL